MNIYSAGIKNTLGVIRTSRHWPNYTSYTEYIQVILKKHSEGFEQVAEVLSVIRYTIVVYLPIITVLNQLITSLYMLVLILYK